MQQQLDAPTLWSVIRVTRLARRELGARPNTEPDRRAGLVPGGHQAMQWRPRRDGQLASNAGTWDRVDSDVRIIVSDVLQFLDMVLSKPF